MGHGTDRVGSPSRDKVIEEVPDDRKARAAAGAESRNQQLRGSQREQAPGELGAPEDRGRGEDPDEGRRIPREAQFKGSPSSLRRSDENVARRCYQAGNGRD